MLIQKKLKPDQAFPDAPRFALISGIEVPSSSDWAARPLLWRDQEKVPVSEPVSSGQRIADDTAIFYENANSGTSISLDTDPFAVTIEVPSEMGAFLSLAIDLPSLASTSLTRRQLIRFETDVTTNVSSKVHARLNIRNGQNTDVLTAPLSCSGPSVVDFDLFHSEIDESRIEAAWIDLIFSEPTPGRILINDVRLSRRPRARF